MSGEWRARAATLEATVWLLVARSLVTAVPFGRWRRWLGSPTAATTGAPAVHLPENLAARRLARAVERAADRLPGETRCLPRAMALQWMLHRRGLGGRVVIGVRARQARGRLDDLHAWVERDGETLIGASDVPHHPLFAATRGRRRGGNGA